MAAKFGGNNSKNMRKKFQSNNILVIRLEQHILPDESSTKDS
jgi:hypothetical protein